MNNQKADNRIEWIDFAKGVAIILTIVAHSIYEGPVGSTLRGYIYSFHMPLFFTLSALTFKYSSNMEEFKKRTLNAFKHLIIPAIIALVLLTALEVITNLSNLTDLHYWKGKVYSFIFASGTNLTFNWETVGGIGITWFFFVLFTGRTVFDFIHMVTGDDKKPGVIVTIFSLMGVLLGMTGNWLPLSLDISLAVMPFFYMGYLMKKLDMNKNTVRRLLVAFVVWIVTLYITSPHLSSSFYLELSPRRYNLYPVCFITAMAGTLVLSYISVLICRIPYVTKPVTKLGKYSLYLLLVHIFDGYFGRLWGFGPNQYIRCLCRLCVDIAFFLVILLIRYLLRLIIEKASKHETH